MLSLIALASAQQAASVLREHHAWNITYMAKSFPNHVLGSDECHESLLRRFQNHQTLIRPVLVLVIALSPLRMHRLLPVLSARYVTPWNGHGYKVAETVNFKFSSISPVWLQIKKTPGKKSSELTGMGDDRPPLIPC